MHWTVPFTSNIRMGGGVSGFYCSMGVGSRCSWSPGIFTHAAESLESGPNRAMETPSEKMERLVQADQNPTVTRITGVYTRGEEKSMSEWKARRTFEQMGHDRSRPHQVWVKDRSLWLYRVQDETFRGCGYTPGTIFKNTIFRRPVSVTLLWRRSAL